MIGIQVAGEWLDTFPDTSISLTLENPIFADGNVIPGSFSLPFSIPGGDDSPTNARILKHPDVITNVQGRFEIIDAVLYVDGLYYLKGNLYVEEATDGTYKANFIFSLKNIRADFKDYTLPDLVDETIQITLQAYSKDVVVKFGGTAPTPYELIVLGETYSGATLADLATAIDAIPGVSSSYETTDDDYGMTGDRVKVHHVFDWGTGPLTVDFPETMIVPGSEIRSNPFTAFNAAYGAWLDTFYDVSPPTDYLYIPIVQNFQPDYSNQLINEVTYTGYKLGTLSGSVTKGNPYQPFVTLKHVFDKITEEFGITFTGTFFEDPFYPKALFFHTARLWTDMEYIRGETFRFYDNSFNVRRLVPDISVEALLKGLQTKYNLTITFSNEGSEITLDYRKAILMATESMDYTSIAGPIDLIAFDNTDGITLESVVEKADKSDTEDKYIYGGGARKITSNLGSLKDDMLSAYTFNFPAVQQEFGSSFIPRLFFYNGLGDNNGLSYQEASYKGMEVTYSGSGGLGESQWYEYLAFLSTRKLVTRTMSFEYRHLAALDFKKKIMIDGTRYLIKTVSVRITNSGIEPAKVSMYKVV